jgi:phosphatidylglycerophosphate synthase
VKSSISDEVINTVLIRPLAALVVRPLYRTPITPNQVTIASTAIGITAAYFYLDGTAAHNIVAGICLTLKDIFDSADGQLARAKQLYSRSGRFLDSIGDFFVNLMAIATISYALAQTSQSPLPVLLGLFGFLSLTLRVSYHVYYQTSYLHIHNAYEMNRLREDIHPEDLRQDQKTLRLQRVFLLLYGWQDRLMERLDMWCRGELSHDESCNEAWYGDRIGLKISGLLGLGTELFVLMLFSITNNLGWYFYFNLVAMNGVLGFSLWYRKGPLRRRLMRAGPPFRPEDSR